MLLRQDNCGITICDETGRNALMYACMHALPQIVELLLSHKGCDPCQQDPEGDTPLIACCRMAEQNQTNLKTYVRIVQMLLKRDDCGIAICDKKGRNALMYACIYALPDIAELLLNHKMCNPCQQDVDGNTPLIACCLNAYENQTNLEKYVRIVQMLLKQDNCGIALGNKYGNNALIYACNHALPGIVELLLSHRGCNPCQQDLEGHTPLVVCCRMAGQNQTDLDIYVRIVQMLLKQDNCGIALGNKYGKNALKYACMHALPGIVELLLSHRGCNPCQQDLEGDTPLIVCCSMAGQNQTDLDKYVRIVQMLLKKDNCGIALCNKEGRNALMYACMHSSPEIVELLLRHSNWDLCQQDQNGHTALIICCYKENSLLHREAKIHIIKMLLKHENCGIAICNYEGQSALHYACGFAFV